LLAQFASHQNHAGIVPIYMKEDVANRVNKIHDLKYWIYIVGKKKKKKKSKIVRQTRIWSNFLVQYLDQTNILKKKRIVRQKKKKKNKKNKKKSI
jgi:hypothetical protein